MQEYRLVIERMTSSGKISRKTTTTMSAPTLLEHGRMRFMITDQPDEKGLTAYAELLKVNKVAHLARACEPSYSPVLLEKNGIQVHDFLFEDGSAPPPAVLKPWLDLVEACFVDKKSADYLGEDARIGVHCVAGLGRAPVLVVVALIEDGMEPLEAAEFVRSKRKGALNTTQLHWIGQYSRTRASRWNRLTKGSECVII